MDDHLADSSASQAGEIMDMIKMGGGVEHVFHFRKIYPLALGGCDPVFRFADSTTRSTPPPFRAGIIRFLRYP